MSSRWSPMAWIYGVGVVVGLIGLGCRTPATRAQDDKPAAEAPEAGDADGDPVARHEAAKAELKKIEATLKELQTQYQRASPARKREIEAEFNSLVAAVEPTQAKIARTARAAFKAAPDQAEKLLPALADAIQYDISKDRVESALAEAQELIEQGHDTPEIRAAAAVAAYAMDDFDAAGEHLAKAKSNGKAPRSVTQVEQDLETAAKAWAREQDVRKQEAEADDLPRVKLETTAGDMTIELYENEAPDTVGNFVSLVKNGFYDGLKFHRVLPGFMAQGGCPKGTGTGGPGYKIFCECQKKGHRDHFRGTLSMAHAGKDTGGSQFFLTFRRTGFLDGKHTVFGRVTEGLDVLEKIQRVDPENPNPDLEPTQIVKATVVRARDHEYKPKVSSKGD